MGGVGEQTSVPIRWTNVQGQTALQQSSPLPPPLLHALIALSLDWLCTPCVSDKRSPLPPQQAWCNMHAHALTYTRTYTNSLDRLCAPRPCDKRPPFMSQQARCNLPPNSNDAPAQQQAIHPHYFGFDTYDKGLLPETAPDNRDEHSIKIRYEEHTLNPNVKGTKAVLPNTAHTCAVAPCTLRAASPSLLAVKWPRPPPCRAAARPTGPLWSAHAGCSACLRGEQEREWHYFQRQRVAREAVQARRAAARPTGRL